MGAWQSDRDRGFVAGNTRNERAPGHPVAIELSGPAIGQRLWSAGRIPAKPRRDGSGAIARRKTRDVCGQDLQEARGEEMAVDVAEVHEGDSNALPSGMGPSRAS